jgi:hypothetical protein
VTTYGNPLGIQILPGLKASILLSSLGGALVQSVFAYRIFVFSQRQLPVPLLCWVMACARVGTGAATAFIALRYGTIPEFLQHDSWIPILSMSVAAATDILIATSLTCYFLKWKSEVSEFKYEPMYFSHAVSLTALTVTPKNSSKSSSGSRSRTASS